MTDSNSTPLHIIASGMRCQLLTGSYDGSTRSCSCVCPDDCKLTKDVRDKIFNHPVITKRRDDNYNEYQKGLLHA